MDFTKPKIVISKCLGFAACRYNGEIISNDAIKHLEKYVDSIPICPEVEIGLGIPRDPIRIFYSDGELNLIQPSTGNDCTEKMNKFTVKFLDSLAEVDGFILKAKSPSCGLKDTKIYQGQQVIKKSSGLFAGRVLEKFPCKAIENEGRLNNFILREHFLTKLFTLANFRKVKEQKSKNELVKFHTANKYLFMAYNQQQLKKMGKIVANHARNPIDTLLEEYEQYLCKMFERQPKFTSNINMLMHLMGYFSKELERAEKAFFLDTLEKYRVKMIPISVPMNILKSWVIRFGQEYLEGQTIFEPYPEELIQITDSGKGRGL